MLIHLSPLMICHPDTEPCTLVDMVSEELGLKLTGGVELKTCRPHLNPIYLIACAKANRKKVDGLLIETPHPVHEFTLVTRWEVAASHIATHRVHYQILDQEQDAVTETMLRWRRRPAAYQGQSPIVTLQTRMEVSPQMKKIRETTDIVDERGFLLKRTESLQMHTLSRDELFNSVIKGVPPLATAFRMGQ